MKEKIVVRDFRRNQIYEEFGYYAIIPIKILKSSKISANSKILFGLLTSLVKETGYCWAGNVYLSKEMGISVSQIKRLLKELKDNKYIELEVTEGIYRKIFLINCK